MDHSSEDDPITLAEACRLFPTARLTVFTLRAEGGRGNLSIFRLGKRDYTTVRSMREMVRLCQERDRRRDGPLDADRIQSSIAAARQVAERLKRGPTR